MIINTSLPTESRAESLNRWDKTLQAGSWFSELPTPLRQELLAIGVPRTLAPGQHVFRRGDMSNGVYAIVEGGVHISRMAGLAAQSKQALLLVMSSSDWFGETALFDRAPRSHDARASGVTCVLHLGQRALEPLLQAHPSLWRDFGQLLTSKMRTGLQIIEDLTTLPVKTRLAARLLGLATGIRRSDHDAPIDASFSVKISQAELAMLVGCTRQTINFMLAEMQHCGWVRSGRSVIEICDPVALQSEACGLARSG